MAPEHGYERPEVRDYGDLTEMTEATVFFGKEDARVKSDPHDPVAHFS
jgi:hypothetical protein